MRSATRKTLAAALAFGVMSFPVWGPAGAAGAQEVPAAPGGCVRVASSGSSCSFTLGGTHILIGGVVLNAPSSVPVPSVAPSALPTIDPSSLIPTDLPTDIPTVDPTSLIPTDIPTDIPTVDPTSLIPTDVPTVDPTSLIPSIDPSTLIPSIDPSTIVPSIPPSVAAPGAASSSRSHFATSNQSDVVQVSLYSVDADGNQTLVAQCTGGSFCVNPTNARDDLPAGSSMICTLTRSSADALFGCGSI